MLQRLHLKELITTEATGDFTGSKIAKKITSASKPKAKNGNKRMR